MKVVADTMLWVSYCTAKRGYRHRILEAALASGVRIFTSDYILTELADTLTTVFELTPRALKLALKSVDRRSKCVQLKIPRRGWVDGDPDDDPIVHTALLAKADYLVTGDRVLLNLRQVEDVRIISASEFAEIIDYADRNGSGRI